jgi:type III restriction enzyme
MESDEDIRLFVKLPRWFKVETPLGGYNPDWAIVKHEDETIYLVRETKGTKDFLINDPISRQLYLGERFRM